MIDWPAEGAELEAEACGDIAGPDYADDPPRNPRMALWALVLSAVLWALIWWCVRELLEL